MKFGFSWPSGFRDRIFEHTRTYTHACTHARTHTYIYTYIHTYIHTYAHQEAFGIKQTVLVFLHTRTQQLRVIPDENYGAGWGGDGGGGGGVAGFEGKALYFYGGWRGCFFFFVFFFNPVGGWLLSKCIIFCRWWSFSKMQFCGYPLFKWDLLERIHCTISW